MSLGRIYNEYYGRPDEMVNALIDTAKCVLSSEYVKMTVKRALYLKTDIKIERTKRNADPNEGST